MDHGSGHPPDSGSHASWTAHLGRAWRLVGTGLSFAVFGVGGMLLGILIIPVTWLVVHDSGRRQAVARWLVTGSFKAFVEFMRWVRVLDYHIEGLDQVGDLRGCLIVANHPSLIDVVFLLSVFRRAECVVKRAHWSNPFTMGPVRLSGYISNADVQPLIDECTRRLAGGAHLLMFPEGTRTVPGAPLDFHRGAATVAVSAGTDCLPVLIRCTPTTLTKAEPWYHIPHRRVMFEVRVLERIPADFVAGMGDNDRQRAIALTRHLTTLFAGHLGHPDPDRVEGAREVPRPAGNP